MRNKILIILLIACILTGALNQKKVKATEVAVTIGVEVLIYLVTQSIAGGVAISDIFERRTAGDDYVTGITLKDGNTVQLPGGVTYKLTSSFTDSISKNITLQTLSELTNSVTITGNTMKVDTLSVETHNSLNSLNELIRSNPKLKSYINNDTLLGKSMNPLQFENIKSILSVFKGIDKSYYSTYSYWAIFPSIKNVGESGYDTNYYGYTLVMSNYPFFIMNRQANFTDERKSYFYTVFDYISDDWLTYSHKKFNTKNGFSDLFIPLKYDGLSNEFWDNNITVIGNGVMNLGYERWLEIANNEFGGQTLENWEAYVDDVTSQYYSLPLYTLMSLTIDTYDPYPKDDVRVKENEDIVFENISTLDDLDTYFDYVNVGAMQDLADGKTIDNTDSMIRDKVINPVLDRDTTGNPPVENDLSWLDRLFEWFNKHLTSLGDSIVSGIGAIINALGLTGLIEWIGEICGNILSGVVDGFKSIGNILEWILELLGTGVISAITGIGSVLGDILEFLLGLIEGIISGFRELLISLFVPSDGYLDAKVLQLRTKFSFADGIIKIVKGFDSALTGTDPPIVKLGSLDESNKYGINNYVLMDLVWFKRYKPTTDIIMSAALWVIFIWRLFIKLPGIIAGYSAMTYADAKIDEYNNKQGKGD